MKAFRKVVAGLAIAINSSIVTGVCIQWHAQGCGVESLIAAIVFYGGCGFAMWFAADEYIKTRIHN